MDDASFLSLTPSEPIPASPPMFDPQPVPRSALIAFLLSLVLPGAGQFYCGKTSRGLWTLAFFLSALALTIYFTRDLASPDGAWAALLWGVTLRITLFLYGFAFLDAFFTAREMTAGTDAFIAESPRVAAILNLLTRGLGYFYLGQRNLGLGFFVGLACFSPSLAKTTDGGLILEGISVFMGVHAYTLARKSEEQILSTVRLPAQTKSLKGLPSAVPIGLAIVLAMGYFALVLVGVFMPDYSHVSQWGAEISQDSQGVLYQNPAHNLSLRAPVRWTIKNDTPEYILLAVRSDRACSVTLQPMAWSPLVGISAFKGKLAYQLSDTKSLTANVLDEKPTVLSGLEARDIQVSLTQKGQRITEHHIIARKRLTLYDLSTNELTPDAGDVAAPTCASDFSFIRENLVLPH